MSEKNPNDGVVDSYEELARKQQEREKLQASLRGWESPKGRRIPPSRILEFLSAGGIDPRDEIISAEEELSRHVQPGENRMPVQPAEEQEENGQEKPVSTAPISSQDKKTIHESSYSGLKRVIKEGETNPYENLETVPEWWQNVAEHVKGGKIATSQSSKPRQPSEELKNRLDALKERMKPTVSEPEAKAG